MVRSNLLNTRTANFLDLVGNGRIYRVPPYQRDYSWEKEQWEDLWDDVMEMRKRPDDRHYMGALVVEGESDREFLIIDGQQRLATLSLFALAVIAKLTVMADNGIEPEANHERALGLRNRFIGEKDPASLIESSKLILNETDNAFYQDRLVQLKEPRNPRGLIKSNKLLWECYTYYRNQLDAPSINGTDGQSLAEILSETIARQIMFILITVEDEISAYTVFETLNARGLQLTTSDLIKNYFFSRIQVQTDKEHLQRRWRALVATVRQERFSEFLRYHMLCEFPKIRSERLFKLIRDKARSAQDVFSLLDALEGRAEFFAALSDPEHGYWSELPGAKSLIRELRLFKVRQMTPLLFAAWECLYLKGQKEDFVRVLKLISVISFRYSIVCHLNTNELEPVYHQGAKAILDGRAKSAAQVFGYLKSIYVEDEKFRQDFALLDLDAVGQKRKIAKYMLAKLEGDASGKPCDWETDTATIEHILPENPSADWGSEIPSERWDALADRLGNMTLLEVPLNRQIGNAVYAGKLPIYRQSVYRMTSGLADFAPERWTIDFINKRQGEFADRAVRLWRPDFL